MLEEAPFHDGLEQETSEERFVLIKMVPHEGWVSEPTAGFLKPTCPDYVAFASKALRKNDQRNTVEIVDSYPLSFNV
ncbi:MAG: hypothetical protein AB7T05_01985 [Fimbriimonadaceae bacterium]